MMRVSTLPRSCVLRQTAVSRNELHLGGGTVRSSATRPSAPRAAARRWLSSAAPSSSAPQREVAHTLRRFGVQRVRPWLAEALHRAGFSVPTPIQREVMPLVARHEHTAIHAPTGAGKTLAFLVPMVL